MKKSIIKNKLPKIKIVKTKRLRKDRIKIYQLIKIMIQATRNLNILVFNSENCEIK